MECRNCELRQRQFYCPTCVKARVQEFQSQHSHFSTDLSSVVSSASAGLTNIVQPARTTRARVAAARGRIEEIVAGLGGIKRDCEKKRDKIRKLREDLAQRRRTLGAARILVKAGSSTLIASSPPSATVPSTPSSAVFFSSPLPDGHSFDVPLPPSPAHLALTQTLARARSGLVQELVEVFNIVEVGGRPPIGGKAGTKGEWTIGGLVLPVPGDIRRYPPNHIDAVLTLTIHFLSLLSFYLGIKLPFEVAWTGGKLGLGWPWIGAIRGGSTGGGDGGWGRWHQKHPLHLTGQSKSVEAFDNASSPTWASEDRDKEDRTASSNSSSSHDEDRMASSVSTVKGLTAAARPSLHPINTVISSPTNYDPCSADLGRKHPEVRVSQQHRTSSNPETPLASGPAASTRQRTTSSSFAARATPSSPVPSPLSGEPPYRRVSTLSFTSALAGMGGAMRKGVGGVVSAGAGVIGYGPSSGTSASGVGSLEESAYIVRSPDSPLTITTASTKKNKNLTTAERASKAASQRNHETPAHLSPSTAPVSFTTGYTMLIYNVCYLAHTQRVVPEVGLSQAGDVLSNLWRCCCSAELGRMGHESVGWGSVPGGNWNVSPLSPLTPQTMWAAFTGPGDTMDAQFSSALTLVRLPPPTPATFGMDFGQLLQAVSGAGGGVRGKTKIRKVYTESRSGGKGEAVVDMEDGFGYEDVASEDRELKDKDEWDLVDGNVSL